MNYFSLGKHQTIEENVLFTAMGLYDILQEGMHIDELFVEFSRRQELTLSINIERIMYLSLTFLFSVGKISCNHNVVKRV